MVAAQGEGGSYTAVADPAFERLYVDAWATVFSYALVLLRNYAEAEDATSETFIRAYSAWLDGHGPRTDATAWLMIITRHLVIDRARRRRLIGWIPLVNAHDLASKDGRLDESETIMWFRQLAAALPARQHEALLLRYEFDYSDDQIAKTMGISAGAARTHISRALAVLRARPEVWQ